MNCLKTYFYAEHELRFIAANLIEGHEHFDRFIVCEHNRTHTGRPRDMIGWERLRDSLPSHLLSKVEYVPLDISKLTVEAYDDEETIHNVNEPVMRSSFMCVCSLDPDDVVFSVDADEIIYASAYEPAAQIARRDGACLLTLNQFFYRLNWLWEGNEFVAPTVALAKTLQFPSNIRYTGTRLPGFAGCHFSWCLTPEQMVYKLHTYAHPRYRFCADLELLTRSIAEKRYPFDESVDFRLRELESGDPMIPLSIQRLIFEEPRDGAFS